MTFAQKLKELMIEKNITEKELCERTKLTAPTISNYLHGKSTPSVANLGKIAMALNYDYDELYKITFE